MKRDTLVEEDITEPATHELFSTTVSIAQQYSALLQQRGKKRKGGLERAYEGFLELPLPVWLGLMWLGGVTIMGACVLALYLLSLAVQMVAGA